MTNIAVKTEHQVLTILTDKWKFIQLWTWFHGLRHQL